MKMSEKVINLKKEDVKVEDVKEEKVEDQEPKTVIAMTVGMLDNGQLFFNVSNNADLIGLEGLMVYTRKQLDKMWERALEPKEAKKEE